MADDVVASTLDPEFLGVMNPFDVSDGMLATASLIALSVIFVAAQRIHEARNSKRSK